MAVKIAAAMGAHVTVISTSKSKEPDVFKLGAKAFLHSTDQQTMKNARDTFDFILDVRLISLRSFHTAILIIIDGFSAA